MKEGEEIKKMNVSREVKSQRKEKTWTWKNHPYTQYDDKNLNICINYMFLWHLHTSPLCCDINCGDFITIDLIMIIKIGIKLLCEWKENFLLFLRFVLKLNFLLNDFFFQSSRLWFWNKQKYMQRIRFLFCIFLKENKLYIL